MPEVKEPNYFGGSLSRDLIGFMGGYTSVGKAGQIIPFVKNIPKAKSKIDKFFRIVTKGGLAEQFTFSPYEKRLSNLVETYKEPDAWQKAIESLDDSDVYSKAVQKSLELAKKYSQEKECEKIEESLNRLFNS